MLVISCCATILALLATPLASIPLPSTTASRSFADDPCDLGGANHDEPPTFASPDEVFLLESPCYDVNPRVFPFALPEPSDGPPTFSETPCESEEVMPFPSPYAEIILET
jgi:hypothetical protein